LLLSIERIKVRVDLGKELNKKWKTKQIKINFTIICLLQAPEGKPEDRKRYFIKY